jgi:putative oxidoreductase
MTVTTRANDAADFLLLAGRVMLALLFLFSGWSKLTGFGGTVGYLGQLGAPVPMLAAIIAVVVELGGAILVIIGYKARWAALALAAFTIGATLLAHRYWSFPAEEQMIQYLMFWKNLGLAGGFLLLAATGPGRWSLDARR